MSKTRLILKLEAMAYPYLFDIENLEFLQFHKLVMWLEDTQIRSLPEDKRMGLKSLVAPQQWWPTFVEYCKSLGYKKPLPLPKLEGHTVRADNNFRMAVDWLVGKALRFFYADDDGATRYNEGHATFIQTQKPLSQQLGGAKTAASGVNNFMRDSFTVDNPEAFEAQVHQLCDTLSLARTGDTGADLALCARMIRQLVALNAAKDTDATKKSPSELLRGIPLGFSTGDQKLDNACKLLRVLYTADMRELQDTVDDTIIKLQNVTGDPRTDTRLGKVGS